MNEALPVQIRNPFAFREALQVAIESTQMDLPQDQVSILRRLVSLTPSQVKPAVVQIERREQTALLSCHAYFCQTRTYYWLREDLCTALTLVMTPLQKGGDLNHGPRP